MIVAHSFGGFPTLHLSSVHPEAIAGALYLVSGAIFPVDILPSFVQPIAYAFPTTWWLEASRRARVSLS